MPVPLVKHMASDDRLLVQGASTILAESGTLQYLTASASVSVTLLDWLTGEEVAGETWPLALTYIPGSQGDFHTVLRDTLTVTLGQLLRMTLTMDNGVDQARVLSLRCQVRADGVP